VAKKSKPATRDPKGKSHKHARRSATQDADEQARPDEEDDDLDEQESDESESDDDEDDEPRSNARSRAVSLWGLRLRTWVLLGGVVAIVTYYLISNREPRPAAPEAGDVVNADITLVTADRNDLDCMAARGIRSYKCGFSNEKTRNTVDERHRLRPFMTLDRTLTLVPGLFLEPAIQARFKAEPPDKPRDQLKRFTAKCKVKIVGELDGVRLRWRPGASWESRLDNVRVGTVSGCRVEG